LLEHFLYLRSIDAQYIEHYARGGTRCLAVATRVVEQSDQQMLGSNVLVLQTSGLLSRVAEYAT
jgi:hypothetical protein